MKGRDSEERHALANALDKIGNALGAIASVMADHERRIERIDGMLDGMGKGAASRIEAMEGRIAAIERKLHHKGGDE